MPTRITVKTSDFQYAPKPFSIDMCEEPSLLFLLRSLGAKLNAFWDIGASSLGYMSLNLASMESFKGLVYSFEPNPKSFIQLETLVKVLDKSAQVSVHNLALSSKSGSGVLCAPSSTHSGYSHIVIDGMVTKAEVKYNVELKTIDELVLSGEFQAPDFIKLDVEGHEMEVLKGGMQTIRDSKPIIFFEYNSSEIHDTVCTLMALNYRILKLYWLFDDKGNVTLQENPTQPLGQRLVGFVINDAMEYAHIPEGFGNTNLLGVHIDQFQEVTSRLFGNSNIHEDFSSMISAIEKLESETEICNFVSEVLNQRFLADVSSLETIIQWGAESSPNSFRRELREHCLYAFERLPGLDLDIDGIKSGSKTATTRNSPDAVVFLREFARNIAHLVR